MKLLFDSCFDAIRLLSILPAPGSNEPARPALMHWFPAVGILIGLILAGTDRWLLWISPKADWLSPILLVALWLILTRGLHIDGLADTFDALGAVGDRARRLDILRDPHIGAIGTAAVSIVVFAKIWALMSLTHHLRPAALVAAPLCARWLAVLACALFPYARKEGLGAAFIGQARWTHVASTGAVTIGTLVFAAGHVALPLFAAAAVTGFGIAFLANRAFGGITGDVLGAMIEVSECAGLFVFAIVAS